MTFVLMYLLIITVLLLVSRVAAGRGGEGVAVTGAALLSVAAAVGVAVSATVDAHRVEERLGGRWQSAAALPLRPLDDRRPDDLVRAITDGSVTLRKVTVRRHLGPDLTAYAVRRHDTRTVLRCDDLKDCAKITDRELRHAALGD